MRDRRRQRSTKKSLVAASRYHGSVWSGRRLGDLLVVWRTVINPVLDHVHHCLIEERAALWHSSADRLRSFEFLNQVAIGRVIGSDSIEGADLQAGNIDQGVVTVVGSGKIHPGWQAGAGRAGMAAGAHWSEDLRLNLPKGCGYCIVHCHIDVCGYADIAAGILCFGG